MSRMVAGFGTHKKEQEVSESNIRDGGGSGGGGPSEGPESTRKNRKSTSEYTGCWW